MPANAEFTPSRITSLRHNPGAAQLCGFPTALIVRAVLTPLTSFFRWSVHRRASFTIWGFPACFHIGL